MEQTADAKLAEARPLVRLEGVGMRFGEQQVLHGITLDIQRGQTTALIGESGCGKTVLLKLIIALLAPTEGRVLFDGKELIRLSERELTQERLRFGFLFQGAALFDSLTVFDNVAFPLREHTQKSEEEIRAEVRQRLEEVGLSENVEGRRPAELSGGMKKRVALARAVILNPELILYDEPTTGLDPVMSQVIDDLIRQMHERRGVTSLVVTHDIGTVRRVAERVVMLYPLPQLAPGDGQIIFDGDRQALDQCPDERVARFVRASGAPRAAGERVKDTEVAS